MCNSECVPARYSRGKKKGQIIHGDHGGKLARAELIKRDGPPPFPGAVCRHMCKNDSEAIKRENGFTCILHVEWGTPKQNTADQGEKQTGKINGKIAAKINNSIERTCPYCGRTMKGPGYFRYHGDKCKLAPPPSVVASE